MRLLLILIALVLLAPLCATYDPMRTDTAAQRQPPSLDHWLGTDGLGRDVWSRLAAGGGRTFGIAALASGIALLPGIALGLLLSAAPRRVTGVADLLITAILAFPTLITALIIMTLMGQGAFPLALAVGIAQIAPTVRVVRGAALSIRGEAYIESARAAGATPMRLLLVHILPNIAPTVLAYAGVVFSYSLLNSAALSFLGLGGEPGVPDWGVMLAEGRQAFRTAPWIALASGAAITLSVMIVNRATDRR
jgi:peptide/nickel transport system permease protein